MFYDVSPSPRGTSRTPMPHTCELCKYVGAHTFDLMREPEDEQDRDREFEEITVCDKCLVDMVLDRP